MSDNGLFQVWCQLTTGGQPILPSFFSIFTDPMFFDTVIWPLDHPAEAFNRLMSTRDRPARGAGPGGAAPGGAARGAPGAPAAAGAPGANAAGGGGAAAAGAPGRGGGGGGGRAGAAPAGGPALPPVAVVNPPDYPWDPSGANAGGVRSITALQGDPGFDVLILNDQVEWPENARVNIQRAVDSGHGFVVIHHALGDNNTWPTWYQELAGGLFVTSDHDGMKKSTVTRNVTLDVSPAGKHPIVADLKPMRLVKEDLYKGMWQGPNITPLLTTNHAASDRVVAWVGPHPKARVVCIQAGTSKETHQNPTFRRLVHNSIMWAAGRYD